MKARPINGRAPFLHLMALAIAAAMTLCALAPALAYAEDETHVAHSIDSSGARTDYASISKAVEAGFAGATIVMDDDWSFGDGNLDVESDKSLTIDMNGHKMIGTGPTGVIVLHANATLKLTSSAEADCLFYQGYAKINGYQGNQSWNWVKTYVKSSGLVTNNDESKGVASGIWLETDSVLDMENVAVAGCGHSGLFVDGACTINMKNSSICNNSTDVHGDGNGGGIYCAYAGATLNMDNSHIDENYAHSNGGGIYTARDENINLINGSTISRNAAYCSGGGIYFDGQGFTLKSDDGTGTISENASLMESSGSDYKNRSGGGIQVNTVQGESSCLIKNVNIKDNYSAYDGGGIILNDDTQLVDCKITGNAAARDGGGISVSSYNSSIENCTITNNYCNAGGGDYEGGGLFVSYHYDIKMSGLCTVKDNTRGKDTGNDDDVFLSTISGQTGFAYITGSLSKGSSVGVRTGITDDRRIAKNFTPPSGKDCFFINLDGYYVSYGTDEGGDAWQRHTDLDFDLSVNGTSTGKYKWKSEATVNATSTDSSKVFKRWNADDSTGLHPMSDYISGDKVYDPQLSFKMPQNNVSLAAEYVTRTRKVTVALQAPSAGQWLNYEGTLTWTAVDGDDESAHDMKIAVSWYKKASDGTLTPAAGKAEEGVVYVARLSAAQDVKDDRAFALDLAASDVEVNLTNGTKEKLGAAEANVDASGALNITTNGYELGAVITKIKPISLVLPEGTSLSEFENKFPKTATGITAAGTLVSLSFADGQDMSSLFEDGKLIKPSKNPATLKLELKKTDEATLPDDLTAEVKLSVTDADAEEVEAPTINLDEGSYSSDDPAVTVEDGKVMLAVGCADVDAQIMYNLSHLGDSEWKIDESSAGCSGEIGLPLPAAGKQITYKLEAWAVKDDGSMSAARTLVYTVKNAAQPEMKTVTIEYEDTAVAGQGASWEPKTYKVEKGSPFAFTAPEHEGYSFEKWVDSNGETIGTGGTVELGKVSSDELITAVYNPVVSGLDVSFALPQADQPLAASADCVKAKIADSGKYADVTKYFAGDDGKVAIKWSHGGKGGATAAHDTTYAATMALSISSSDGVKYVLSPNPEILVSGNEGEYGAYAAEEDGKASLSVVCPTTGAYELPSISALSDEKVSFEQAQRCKKKQDAGQGASAWNLPDQVKVTYKCGESEMLDIAWGSIDSFNESAGAQELTAKGTVTFPEYVDNDDGQGGLVSNEVSVKVKVFAPDDDPYAYDLSAAKVTLSKASYTYNGKVKKPKVKLVILGDKVLKEGTDYTAAVASGKKVGTYNVTVTAKGSYTGKATTSFTINPKGVTKFKVSKAKKSFKAKWKKAKAQRSGVQLRYSTKKSMANAKTVKAKGAAAKAKTVKKLKSKKKYYVQARTYKVVNGKTYYSSWSARKAVKTK